MENLILDVKIAIAEKDREVWWLFYYYFDDFKSYTKLYPLHYCRLFTSTIRYLNMTEYLYLNTNYIINDNGDQHWYQNGKLHRDGGPAIIYANSTQFWYQHGKIHRDDGPAAIYTDGEQQWYQYGKYHRDDGPAVICSNGDQFWYLHGKFLI